jgi:hypothetical protein
MENINEDNAATNKSIFQFFAENFVVRSICMIIAIAAGAIGSWKFVQYNVQMAVVAAIDPKAISKRLLEDPNLTAVLISAMQSDPIFLKKIQGPKGDPGLQGLKGDVGTIGPRGEIGALGPVGPRGAEGPRGQIGPQGVTGDKGDISIAYPQTCNEVCKHVGKKCETGEYALDHPVAVPGVASNSMISMGHTETTMRISCETPILQNRMYSCNCY